jgi:hypothetical protein
MLSGMLIGTNIRQAFFWSSALLKVVVKHLSGIFGMYDGLSARALSGLLVPAGEVAEPAS